MLSRSVRFASRLALRRGRALSTTCSEPLDLIPPPSPGRGIVSKWTNFDITKQRETLKKFDWFIKWMEQNSEDDRLFRQSNLVFHTCVNQAAQPEFYPSLSLTPDFRTQQSLLMLHIWMIHRRFMQDGQEGKILQEQVFDRLWEDTILRLRNQNVSELTVNKYLKEVQQYCFSACIAYDRGLEAGESGLATPIHKHLFNLEGESKRREALTLAEYAKKNLKLLEGAKTTDIVDGRVPWGKPPQPTLSSKRNTLNLAELKDEIVGAQYGDWRSALDIRGDVYYWNQRTRLSSWDKPSAAGQSTN